MPQESQLIVDELLVLSRNPEMLNRSHFKTRLEIRRQAAIFAPADGSPETNTRLIAGRLIGPAVASHTDNTLQVVYSSS